MAIKKQIRASLLMAVVPMLFCAMNLKHVLDFSSWPETAVDRVLTSSGNAPVIESKVTEGVKSSSLRKNNVLTRMGNLAEKELIIWNGLSDINMLVYDYYFPQNNNLLCKRIDEVKQKAKNPTLSIAVNISVDCQELFQHGFGGTGNQIALLYGMRLVSQMNKNVELSFTCTDADKTKKDLIMPWLTGVFPPSPRKSRFYDVPIQQACGSYFTAPVSLMYREMQYDFRRMAIGLLGVPGPKHPSAKFAEKYLWSQKRDRYDSSSASPSILQLPVPKQGDVALYPLEALDLDDAVIHFRCGDLMNSDHAGYNFMTFQGFTRHISPKARSIGILTQPFDSTAQNRGADNVDVTGNRCRIVVTSLVAYTQQRFPNASVRIRNDSNETIALTYARMIMANQTIAAGSSFAVYPVIATFGTGYLRRPDPGQGPNIWVLNPPIVKLTDNVVLFEDPNVIMVSSLKQMWDRRGGGEEVLDWFWNGTMA
jgi:hypothetical protein